MRLLHSVVQACHLPHRPILEGTTRRWILGSARKALICSAYRTIWNQDLPLPEREGCVRAMLPLFSDLFSSEPLVHSVCMWWDSFCYDWHCGSRERSQGGDDRSE